jgi:hypothetical protein
VNNPKQSRTSRHTEMQPLLGLVVLLGAVVSLEVNDLCPGCKDDADKSGGACADAKEECKRSLCNPVCLGGSFTCEIKVEGCSGWKGCDKLKEEVEAAPAQESLCSQAIAKTCEGAGICEAQEFVPWVLNFGYGGYSLDNLPVPVDACLSSSLTKEELDARCNACKSGLKLKLTAGVDDVCPPVTNPAHKDSDQYPFDEECKAFDNAGASCEDAAPIHKSYHERCKAVVKDVESQKGGIESGFAKWACTCLGCCSDAPGCPVPVTPTKDLEVDKMPWGNEFGFAPDEKHKDLYLRPPPKK